MFLDKTDENEEDGVETEALEENQKDEDEDFQDLFKSICETKAIKKFNENVTINLENQDETTLAY